MPHLRGVRNILGRDSLLLVWARVYRTRDHRAGRRRPARGTVGGTFTSADRTVHLYDQAVRLPGEAAPTWPPGSTTRDGWGSTTAADG